MSYSNNYNYNNNNNNNGYESSSPKENTLDKIYRKNRGQRISRRSLEDLNIYLNSFKVTPEIDERLSRIMDKVVKKRKLHSNQVNEIRSLLEGNYNNINNNNNNSNNNENNNNNNDLSKALGVDDLDTQASICLHKTKDNCPEDRCVFQDKKCVPNVLSNQKMCHGKGFHDCVAPCKFYGKNIHEKDACHYKYANIEEAKEEHILIAKEIKELKKYIDILQHKNKSIVHNVESEIKTIDKKLVKLVNERNVLLKKQRKSINTYSEYTNKLNEINEKMIKLKNNREELKSILSSIKFIKNIQEKPLKKTRKGKRVQGVKSRGRKSRRRTMY